MNLKKTLKTHIAFVILFVIIATYLGAKAFPENGWDGWFGSSQVYMGAKYWAKDGIIAHKFLLIPMGYSKITKYLDDPDLRHHARGTKTGGLVGNRLYYTHYPNSYITPYALLMKAGIYGRPWHRLTALAFSMAGLALLYVFLNMISSPLVAFFGVLYYGMSTMFLDYADTLSNQSFDDLWRFIILFLSILAVRSIKNSKKYLLLNLFIWLGFFVLQISSYDSTLFVFIWLIGLDVVVFRKFLWKKWLFFASAPAFGFVMQMLQNWWYFGNWRDVLLDILGASTAKIQTKSILSHGWSVSRTLYLATGFKTLWANALVFFSLFSLWKIKNDKFGKPFLFVLVLFLAGAAYPFVFVGSGGFSYQGRQMMPFVGLIVGLAMAYMIAKFKNREKLGKLSVLLGVALVLLWSGQVYRTVQYARDWPNNTVDNKTIELGKTLSLLAKNNAVIFDVEDFNNFEERYPQPDMFLEYYAGAPILNFKKTYDLVDDYNKIKARSVYNFDSIIVADSKEKIKEIGTMLSKQLEIMSLNGKYIALIKG